MVPKFVVSVAILQHETFPPRVCRATSCAFLKFAYFTELLTAAIPCYFYIKRIMSVTCHCAVSPALSKLCFEHAPNAKYLGGSG
jgi:hypothetical protein